MSSQLLFLLGAHAAGVWTRHGGVNCYSAELGLPRDMSLAQCQQQCLQTPTCAGVVQQVRNATWTTHKSVNCYTGHGARELVDGVGTVDDCYQMTLVECQTQCFLTDECSGFAYNGDTAGKGFCCLRADIQLPACDQGGEWNTYVMSPFPAVPIPAGEGEGSK